MSDNGYRRFVFFIRQVLGAIHFFVIQIRIMSLLDHRSYAIDTWVISAEVLKGEHANITLYSESTIKEFNTGEHVKNMKHIVCDEFGKAPKNTYSSTCMFQRQKK